MEGPLSKWTNVVHGWQYRWFVLGEDALVYYTSRDKMTKGQQRGCIRLRGAVVSIDGENQSLLMVSVDGKTFHLQGRDQKERDAWMNAIQSVIRECNGFTTLGGKPSRAVEGIKAKIVEADTYLTSIIEQVKNLECLREKANSAERAKVDELIASSQQLLDTVKHAIILLQMAKNKIEPEKDSENVSAGSSMNLAGGGAGGAPLKPINVEGASTASSLAASPVESVAAHGDTKERLRVPEMIPPISYSSSDDEFYDADEDVVDLNEPAIKADGGIVEAGAGGAGAGMSRSKSIPDEALAVAGEDFDNFDFGDSDEDFDRIYNEGGDEQDVGNVQQQHGSVIVHLLSQVSVGMDLTKVTLPTFILERRSLLEMYADFFAHPEAFITAVDLETPEQRFISVVRYYLNAFYAARKSGVAKKPYNPILGETFRCRYKVPDAAPSGKKTEAGPFAGSDENDVTFIAEQVSHHPPVSAFYAEHPGKRISFHGHIYTKSSFLGLSIGVANIGDGTVILHDYDEKYVVTFPSGYGRSIMSTPWVELGGKVKVTCEKTGYYAEIEFLTKPFFGGKPHRIQGNVFRDGFKKPILTISGQWNGVMYAKGLTGDEYVFIDVKAEPEQKKQCEPVMQQEERESRRLWRHVTAALLRNRIQMATTSKRMIEQRQRAEAKQRLERGEEWKTRFFSQRDDGGWWFNDPLDNRL